MRNRLILFALALIPSSLGFGQAFNGFQTIGQHTVFISLSWDGKANLGLGYNYRNFETSFSDYQIECRVPFDDFNTLNRFTVITGIYRPSKIQKTFLGGGAHLIYTKDNANSNSLALSLTAVPGYVYASKLGDKPYGTVGVLLNSVTTISGDDAFKSLQFGLGAHVDVSLRRSVGLSLNEMKLVTIHDNKATWKNQLSIYAGPTWLLNRN